MIDEISFHQMDEWKETGEADDLVMQEQHLYSQSDQSLCLESVVPSLPLLWNTLDRTTI